MSQVMDPGLARLANAMDEPNTDSVLSAQIGSYQWNFPACGLLNPDHSDDAQVVGYINQLALEAVEARAPWINQAQANLTVYQHGADPEPPDSQVVSNEIQNAVIAITDLQTREPPRAKLSPIENGEPPTYFWLGGEIQPQVIPPQQQVDPATGATVVTPEAIQPVPFGLSPDQMAPWQDTTGAINTPNPLTIDQGEAVEDAIRAGAVKPRMLVAINDKLVAALYQRVFDLFWKRSSIDRRIRSNLLTTNVTGWTMPLYEWDAQRKRHVLRPIGVLESYIDPTQEDIEDAAYAGIDYYLDAYEARAMFPEFARDIENFCQSGVPRVVGQSGAQLPDRFNRYFRRPMVTLRVWWIRNQEIPMSVDEAMEAGAVQQQQVATSIGTPDSVDSVTGQVIPGTPPTTRPALFFNGAEIDPTAVDSRKLPGWPTKLGIRQITYLVQTANVVSDHECEHWDIPLLHNVAIPIPGTPFGQGEPQRLKKLQAGLTKALTATVDHIRWFAHPVTAMSRSMYEATKAEQGKAFVQPGKVLIVPDDQWMAQNGQIYNIIQTPPLSDGVGKVHQLLRDTIREDSGYTNMLRGVETGRLSGVAISSLQNAAASQIGFKSQRTGDMVGRMTRFMLHSLVWRLDVDDLANIISEYPRWVLEKIVERARKAVWWDVDVTVSSGTGMIQQQKKVDAQNDLKIGAISMETYREIAGMDDAVEKERQKNEMQAQAIQAAQAMPQGQPGQQAPPPQ